MATELRFPENLSGVDGIIVTRWLVKVGDTVQPGDILLEAATDKVDTEVPATVGGVILPLPVRRRIQSLKITTQLRPPLLAMSMWRL